MYTNDPLAHYHTNRKQPNQPHWAIMLLVFVIILTLGIFLKD